ncbi:MAG: helix-turn-helix transcriptional regulator [Clostridia bacterium]|nr:helix-turn-helix transcriptional regulator [Clostridia bacterium]
MVSEIGEKIRKLRKSKGLTQAQLAGNAITRNMLSLIENGSASPSIQTLEYLSDRLGVSAAYFFMRDYRDTDQALQKKRDEIKLLYQKKEYLLCIEAIDECYTSNLEEIPDEFLLIASESAMQLGKKYTLRGAFESGSMYLRKAYEYSQKCPYSTEWIDANIFVYEAIIENSDCPVQSLDKDYFLKIRRSTGYEMYNYLFAISLIDEKRSEDAAQFLKFNKMIEPAHKEHINAKFMMLTENKDIKRQALETLCAMIKKAPSYPLDAVTRYLILKDIEFCARALEDFAMAYKYATMRLKIISEMRD